MSEAKQVTHTPGPKDCPPGCMMPDGADPCSGYHALMEENDRLRRELASRAIRTMGPRSPFWNCTICGAAHLTPLSFVHKPGCLLSASPKVPVFPTDETIGRPWRVEKSARTPDRFIVRRVDGAWICDFDGEHAEEWANLVAAAVNSFPGDVYEQASALSSQLQKMLEAIAAGSIDSPEIGGDRDVPPHKWHDEWAHHARAALSKAGAA